MELTLLIIAIILMLVGVAGAVLPFVPGPILIFVGALLYAWPGDHFHRISIWTILLLLVLTIVVQVVDFLMGAWGAKKFGGTWRGVVGALAGTLISVFTGQIWALLFLPLVGAILGELLGGMKLRASGRVGTGAFVGMILGGVVRLGASVLMISIFLFDYFFNRQPLL